MVAGTVAGRLVSGPSDSIVLLVDGTKRFLPLAGVDSLWTRRSHGGQGALVLGGIGAVGGVIAGAIINSMCKDGGDSSGCPRAIPLLGIGGGAAGGLLGYLVGSAIHSYQRRVPGK